MAHTAPTETPTPAKHAEMEECIEYCVQCARECTELVMHCLKQGGEHASPDHIRLLLDCVNACETSAKFMVRRSPLHKIYCRACADVCVRCAEDCAHFQDDEQMMHCAETCRGCAESCESMAR